MQQCGTQTIMTDRLVLRRFEPGDSEDVRLNWASDPLVQSLYSEPVYTTNAEVSALLDKYISSYEGQSYYRWAIVEAHSGIGIGQIAIFTVDEKNHSGEIEYCIGRAFQKHGYATEACKAVIDYAFEQIGLHRVQICHKENNTPSKRVIEKCGLTYEGTLRDYFHIDGKYVSRLYYSILDSEYPMTK